MREASDAAVGTVAAKLQALQTENRELVERLRERELRVVELAVASGRARAGDSGLWRRRAEELGARLNTASAQVRRALSAEASGELRLSASHARALLAVLDGVGVRFEPCPPDDADLAERQEPSLSGLRNFAYGESGNHLTC